MSHVFILRSTVLHFGLRVALTVAAMAIGCDHARPTKDRKLPTTAPASMPATTQAAYSDESAGPFTHVVKADTALILRGKSDADIIYDTVAAGTRVRAVEPSDGFLRIVTEDHRDGLISPERLQLLPVPPSEKSGAAPMAIYSPGHVWPPATMPAGATTRPVPTAIYSTPRIRLRAVKRPDKIVKPSGKEIDDAIDKACRYLYAQERNGLWDEIPRKGEPLWLPNTSLAVVALGEAGESPANPPFCKAIGRIVEARPADTFTASMRAEVLSWPTVHAVVPKAVGADDLVVAAQGKFAQFGPILDSRDAGSFNPRSSYFAQRGISAWESAGGLTPDKFWPTAYSALRNRQEPAGAFRGVGGRDPVDASSATAAGLLSLYNDIDHMPFDRGITTNFDSPNISRALKSLADSMPDTLGQLWTARTYNPCETAWWLNEVLEVSGERHLADQAFGDEIALFLVRSQYDDGSWGHDVSQTAWAIRSLSGYRAPPAIGKLRYPPGQQHAAWNSRPRDVANFVRFLGNSSCEMKLNWEVVDLDRPADEMRQVPVLYLDGARLPVFDEQQKAKLRAFVDHGGLILGNAGSHPVFSQSLTRLGPQLFPKYEFRPLPEGHPIFDEQFHAGKWKHRPSLRSMSNGVRELIILSSSEDLSYAWQANDLKGRRDAFELGADIFLYATGKQLPFVAEDDATDAVAAPPAGKNPDLLVALLDIGDNSNPEPNAWPRMSRVMERKFHLNCVSAPVKLRNNILAGFNLAHLTGTTKFTMTADERKQLKAFVDAGGTLLIDAAGGSVDFAKSADDELKLIFGDEARQLLEPLPSADFFNKQGGMDPLIRVSYRSFAKRSLQLADDHELQLRAIRRNGRLAVIFSREDLTAGMAGIQSDGIVGYTVNDATKIVSEILRHLK
jgi:hypothetical protein